MKIKSGEIFFNHSTNSFKIRFDKKEGFRHQVFIQVIESLIEKKIIHGLIESHGNYIVENTKKTSFLIYELSSLLKINDEVKQALSLTGYDKENRLFSFIEQFKILNKEKLISIYSEQNSSFAKLIFPYNKKIISYIKKNFNGYSFVNDDKNPFWKIRLNLNYFEEFKILIDKFDFKSSPFFYQEANKFINKQRNNIEQEFWKEIQIDSQLENENIFNFYIPNNSPDFLIQKLIKILTTYNLEKEEYMLSELDKGIISFNPFFSEKKQIKDLEQIFNYLSLNNSSENKFEKILKAHNNIKFSEENNRKLSYAVKLPPYEKEIKIPNLNIEKGKLSEYQQVAVKFISEKNKVLIGDDQGVGKTLEVLSSIEYRNTLPALIICPATVKSSWEKEIIGDEFESGWFPNRSVQVINNTKEQINTNVDYVVINYDLIYRKNIKEQLDFLIEKKHFQFVVLDESQYIKNETTKRTKISVNLVKNTPYAALLSATPSTGKPKDYIPQLEALNALRFFGGRKRFEERYCDLQLVTYNNREVRDNNGASHLSELGLKLRSFMIRRTKEQVIPFLPEKRRSFYRIPIENKKIYHAVEKQLNELITDFLKEDKTFQKMYKSFDDKKKAENFKKEYFEKHIKSSEEKERLAISLRTELKQLSEQGKIESVLNFTKDLVEKGEKVILFSTSIIVQKTLFEELNKNNINSVHIFSEDTGKKRKEAIQSFQNNDNTKVIVCSLKAANTGITLTKGSSVVFIGLGETYSDIDQAEDRAHRRGQKKCVNSYLFIAENTVEEDIYKNIMRKKYYQEDAMQDEEQDLYSNLKMI